MQFGAISVTSSAALNLTETTIAQVLSENGYTNYMFGKWHLGNASPRHIPTARGFDYFLGFLAGQNDYWTKHCPEHEGFRDFMYSTKECYYMYDADDVNRYSTFLYRDKAIEVINNHDYDTSSMFLYLSFQAAHDPWTDSGGQFVNGIPKNYFTDGITYVNITSTYKVSI